MGPAALRPTGRHVRPRSRSRALPSPPRHRRHLHHDGGLVGVHAALLRARRTKPGRSRGRTRARATHRDAHAGVRGSVHFCHCSRHLRKRARTDAVLRVPPNRPSIVCIPREALGRTDEKFDVFRPLSAFVLRGHRTTHSRGAIRSGRHSHASVGSADVLGASRARLHGNGGLVQGPGPSRGIHVRADTGGHLYGGRGEPKRPGDRGRHLLLDRGPDPGDRACRQTPERTCGAAGSVGMRADPHPGTLPPMDDSYIGDDRPVEWAAGCLEALGVSP
jgi:hypothetical protein